MLVIYLRFTLLQNLSCLPLGFWSEQLLFFIAEKNPIYLTLHRKEFTWFHYKLIYILSVALVLILRPTDVIRFAALWCPDFPTLENSRINKPFFLWDAKIRFFVGVVVSEYVGEFLERFLLIRKTSTRIFKFVV